MCDTSETERRDIELFEARRRGAAGGAGRGPGRAPHPAGAGPARAGNFRTCVLQAGLGQHQTNKTTVHNSVQVPGPDRAARKCKAQP